MRLRAIYTHADLDGMISALIVLLEHPAARVVPLQFRSVREISVFPAAILDLALPANHPALRVSDNLWIDHHPLAKDLDLEALRCRLKHSRVQAACVSTLAYAIQEWGLARPAEEMRRLRRWVQLADVADRGATEAACHPYARALKDVLWLGGWRHFWGNLVAGEPCADPEASPFPEMAAFAGAVRERQNERGAGVFLDTQRDLGDWVLGILPTGSPSVVGERLSRELGRTVGMVLPPEPGSGVVTVALRGPGAADIARQYGGNGHPTIAGFRLPRERFRYEFELEEEDELPESRR